MYPFRPFLLCCIFVMILLPSCKDLTGIPENFDYGRIENNAYVNDYFEFRFPMENGWQPMDNSIMDSLREKTAEEMAAADPAMQKTMEVADVRTANLLTAMYAPPDEFQLFNANINFIAENVKIALNIRNGRDYLESAKKFMGNMEYSIDFKGDIYEQEIGGKTFYCMDVVNHYGGTDILQSYYATIIKSFAFTFVTTYVTDEQKAAVQSAIDQIEFR